MIRGTKPTALFCLLLLALLLPVFAWAAEGPTGLAVEIDVKPSATEAGAFECMAVIRDAASQEVLSAPKIIFPQGEEGLVQSGLMGGGMVELRVEVDADATAATYETRLVRDEEVVSSQRARIRLAPAEVK